MTEPPLGICGCDGGQCLCHGHLKGLAGACLGFAQVGLQLLPTRRDGRQIRRIGGQVDETGATTGNGLFHTGDFVRSQIVHHDDIAGPQGRGEHVRDIGQKHVAIGCTLERHDGLDALEAQGSQPRHICPIVLGDGPDDSLPLGRTTIQTGHGPVHP